jgi:hypothetical protein
VRPLRIIGIVFGSLIALIAMGVLVGGGVAIWAHTTQRDEAGYYTAGPETLASDAYAITSDSVDLQFDARKGGAWVPFDDVGTVRVAVTRTDGGEVFVGIAPQADVDAYLQGTAHDEIVDLALNPFEVEYRREAGEAAPAAPVDQAFWVESAQGAGQQALTWEISDGEWAVVVMNGDASPAVSVEATAGVNTGILLPIGIGLLIAGLVLGAIAATLLYLAIRRPRTPTYYAGPVEGTTLARDDAVGRPTEPPPFVDSRDTGSQGGPGT